MKNDTKQSYDFDAPYDILQKTGGFIKILIPNVQFFIILWFSFIILFSTAGNVTAQPWYSVKWVNDGDTIVLTNGKRVRYIGV
ncbi:MAG: hypothetical protein QNL14_08315, partial [Deltaproteobacteria bacterium]|nr:hypothetical protein [Deltaproteobacteria bacterium]